MDKVKNYVFGLVVLFILIVLIQNSTFIFGSVPFTFLMWTQSVSIIILLIASAVVGYFTADVRGFLNAGFVCCFEYAAVAAMIRSVRAHSPLSSFPSKLITPNFGEMSSGGNELFL